MPMHLSVLHQLLQQVPWPFFAQLVASCDADRRVRRLSTRDQFVALLFAQLCGATSLREIEAALASPCGRQAGASGRLCRATLADANAKRPCAVFVRLLARMAQRGGRRLRRATGQKLRLVDATPLRLAGRAAQWARFSDGVHGAKAHIVFDPDAACPLRFCLTPAKVNDITCAKAMPLEPGATYVFDLGYYDFAWWAGIDRAGCRFVTRLKKNTALQGVEEKPLPPGSPVLSDRVGRLPRRMAKSRENPFAKPLREVRVATRTGKELRILTNDLDAPAGEIAGIYRQRWQIELFFRWIKHTLKLKHFLGRSQNAVCIQVAVALIAFVLLSIAKAAARTCQSLLTCARLVRINLLGHKSLKRLFRPPKQQSRKQSANRLKTNTT